MRLIFASQHRESKHAYCCERCSKVLNSQQALEQHIRDKHSFFECRFCDREFTTAQGRDAHEDAKHSTFECNYCDREFNSEQAREQHEDAQHSTFECRYCNREFNSEQAREQHEDAKHTFECRYCDRKFNSEQAREQHEDAQHTFECRHCDRNFSSEAAREQHEDAQHSAIECRYCDREFSSEKAREQHEDAKHHIICGSSFSQAAAPRLHEQSTPHFECSYCTTKLFSTALKRAHEVACDSNPVNFRLAATPPIQWGSSSSNDSKSTEMIEEEESPSEGSEPPTPPSPSSQDEGELFHSTSALPSTDANNERPTVTQPCACTHSFDPGSCSRCQPSNTNQPVSDDGESVFSADENHQDDSKDHRDVIFQCTPCLELFESEDSFRNHVCVFRKITLRPHCPVCYTQFDDGSLLQKHLEGLEAFSCQLCLTRCCSDEMLQDHLLSHPTCGKCGKAFADNLTLCAVRILRSHDHVIDEHAIH